MAAAIIAAVTLLVPPANHTNRIAQKPPAVAQAPRTPAQRAAPAPPAPVVVARLPRQPKPSAAVRPAPQPVSGSAAARSRAGRTTLETADAGAQDLRALGSEYEQQGDLDQALAAYEQADAAANATTPSLDSARVYERMGYTADAVDHYVDLAFSSSAEAAGLDGG
jgi:tetratricopeptide (TPR) repeat protein